MIQNILKKYSIEFEESLNEFFKPDNSNYKVVSDAMQYSLRLGGKRLRPFLLKEFYSMCGGKEKCSSNFEVAIECIHTYSLIHDDLPCMDNDDFRRGKPSCHKTFGEANALLAGDALLTEAFNIASKTKNIDSGYVLKAIEVIASRAGIQGMIGGQTIDLLSEGKNVDENILKEICHLKTGALIEAACVIGCILAGASAQEITGAKNYANALGLAFQIQDDILDCIGDMKKLGKPIHSDEDNDKSTFVSLYGVDKCKDLVKELTDKAKFSLEIFEEKADALKELADFLCTRDY